MKTTWHLIAIVLGLVAPTFELITRICTNLFFDPLPTIGHIIAYYATPLALLAALVIMHSAPNRTKSRIVGVLLAYAFVMSLAYSIWFLPISWISAMGIMFIGIGGFGLVPFVLFAASITMHRAWRTWQPGPVPLRQFNRFAWYTLLMIPILVIIWWNAIVLKTADSYLESDSIARRETGLFILDHFASEEQHRRHCFAINNRLLDVEVYNANRLRDAYYILHGVRSGLSQVSTSRFENQWRFDDQQGSTVIGVKQDGLFIDESALDVVARPMQDYAYTEWTMVFRNDGRVSREARAAIQLPPQSVVSKVSLWVDGEERPAAFGQSSHVKSVYKSIVQRRRDPMLVTVIGPDQVQMQCFPVPADGTMKVRLGITSPLIDGRIGTLPSIIESNFHQKESFRHILWFDSDTPWEYNLSASVDGAEDGIMTLTDEQLGRPDNYFVFEIDPPTEYTDSAGTVIMTRETGTDGTKPPVLLIDGRRDVADMLGTVRLPVDEFTAVIVARPFDWVRMEGRSDVAEFLSKSAEYAGVNPTPGLLEALRIAGQSETAVLWLHGSLPADMRSELGIEQVLRRTRRQIPIVTLQLSDQLNSLISDPAYMRYFQPSVRLGDLQSDLDRAVHAAGVIAAEVAHDGGEKVYLGGNPNSGVVITDFVTDSTDHPGRLCLASRAMQQWNSTGGVDAGLQARLLESRLVTPVTGAVVLESARQYATARLDPSVGAEHIPTVPEPEFYLLLIAGLTGTWYVMRKRGYVW